MEEGTFYETLLFAQSQHLPIVIIVENNQWSLASTIEQRRCPIRVRNMCDAVKAAYICLESNDVYDYTQCLRALRDDVLEKRSAGCVEVKLTTLGDWRLKTDDYPEGKFINYHAGPGPGRRII